MVTPNQNSPGPGILDPNDPTAQAMIAGQGMFPPVQTNPSAGMAPVAPTTPPIAPSNTNEAMVQPGASPEAAPVEAAAPPLPEGGAPIATSVSKTSTSEPNVSDEELDQIQSYGLDDVVDPEVLQALRDKALPKHGPGALLESITKGLNYAGAEFRKPGSSQPMIAQDEKDQADALNTLTQLEGQVNQYKREALRQHAVRKATEAKSDTNLQKVQFQEQSRMVRETLKQAQTLGVTPPIPPTTEAIAKDPESVTAWIDQANQLIEQKRTAHDIVGKQIPLFEEMAKRGADGKLIHKAFDDMLSANGISEAEKKQMYGSVGLMLESQAQQTKNKNDAWLKERSMRSANLQSMIKGRDDTATRLSQNIAKGDVHAASIELRQLTNQKLHVAQQLGTLQTQIAMATASQQAGLQPGQPGYVPEEIITSLSAEVAQLQTLQANLENLELYATDSLTKNFNVTRADVALNDKTREAKMQLISQWPEAQQAFGAGGIDQFIKDHKSDPRVREYFQGIANSYIISVPPASGQAASDHIDQNRIKHLNKDSAYNNFMGPLTYGNQGATQTGPSGGTPK